MSPILKLVQILTFVASGKDDDPIWIPVELCTVMPGQTYGKKLNGNQTTRMLTVAARPPAENASRIVAADGGLGLIGVLRDDSDVPTNLVSPLVYAFNLMRLGSFLPSSPLSESRSNPV